MPEAHYQLFLAYSRLNRKADADRELSSFKHLDEDIKAHRVKDPNAEYKTLNTPAAVVQP
jgi:hypothetical protein